jgi:hypothetical protein
MALPFTLELDAQSSDGYRDAAKLENRQIRSKHSLSICWLGYEIPESVSFRSDREGTRREMLETGRKSQKHVAYRCDTTVQGIKSREASSCGVKWQIYHQELPPGPEGLP